MKIPTDHYQVAMDRLIYDESSPSGLRWKNDGAEAGCQDADGYWLVRVDGTLLRAHRIIWFMHHQTMPDLIDHRDGDPSNNREGNLREATEGQNRANGKKHADGKNPAKGVCWDKRTKSWIVKCCVNRKQHHGGRFKDLGEAKAAAIALRNQLHQEFARHD